MAWKEIRNGEPVSRNTTNSGICKLCGKRAEVTSFFYAPMKPKKDLQKTYDFMGYKCSLQENSFQNPACMDECPLIQKELL